jgi:hypothetical protein
MNPAISPLSWNGGTVTWLMALANYRFRQTSRRCRVSQHACSLPGRRSRSPRRRRSSAETVPRPGRGQRGRTEIRSPPPTLQLLRRKGTFRSLLESRRRTGHSRPLTLITPADRGVAAAGYPESRGVSGRRPRGRPQSAGVINVADAEMGHAIGPDGSAEHGPQVVGDGPFQLVEGARRRVAVGAPALELHGVPKTGSLHVVVSNLHDQLGAYSHE